MTSLERAEKAEAALAAVTAERDRMREALSGLVERIRYVTEHPRYRAVWESAQLQLGPYDGPQYVGAFDAAEAALASTPAPASMPLAEVEAYGMKVAEAVLDECWSEWGSTAAGDESRDVDLAAVVKGVK